MAQSERKHDFLRTTKHQESVYALDDQLRSQTRIQDQFLTTTKEFSIKQAEHQKTCSCSLHDSLPSAYCRNVAASGKTIPFEYDPTARFTSEQAKATKYVKSLSSNISKLACEGKDFLRTKKHDSIYILAQDQLKPNSTECDLRTTQQLAYSRSITRSTDEKARAIAECQTSSAETGFTRALNKDKPVLTDDVARYTSEIRKSQKYTQQPVRKIEQYATQKSHSFLKTGLGETAYTAQARLEKGGASCFETENQAQYRVMDRKKDYKGISQALTPQTESAFTANILPSSGTRPFEYDPTKRYTSEMAKASKYTKIVKPIGWFE